MTKTGNYTDMLLEDMNSKFELILEIVTPLARLPQEMRELREDVSKIKTELKVTNTVLRDHSLKLQNHQRRIVKLERGVAQA